MAQSAQQAPTIGRQRLQQTFHALEGDVRALSLALASVQPPRRLHRAAGEIVEAFDMQPNLFHCRSPV